MAYVKKDWEDLPSQTTPVTANDLDRIENGIENNDERLNGTKAIDNTIYVNDVKCKNLFNYSGVASSYYHNGITFTNNGDGTITANGTASGVAYWDLITNIQGIGNYTLSGCPSGGGDNTYKQILMRYSDYNGVDDTGNGATRTFSSGVNYGIRLRIASGYVCNNVVFSPMLELGSAVTTYTPYKNFDNTINAMVITRNGSEDISITTAYQHKTIDLDITNTKIGDKLTYNSVNKSIVIGSGVHHIEASACVVMSHSSSSVTDRYFSIRKNSNDNVSSVYQYLNIPANYVYILNIPSIIIDVNEGDEIYATVTSGITETISIKGSPNKRVFLNVKVID